MCVFTKKRETLWQEMVKKAPGMQKGVRQFLRTHLNMAKPRLTDMWHQLGPTMKDVKPTG